MALTLHACEHSGFLDPRGFSVFLRQQVKETPLGDTDLGGVVTQILLL